MVVAACCLSFIIAVSVSTFIVSYVFLATSREAEYRIIRDEYTALIEREVQNKEVQMNRLAGQVNRNEFVMDKRYNLLMEEIDLLKREVRRLENKNNK